MIRKMSVLVLALAVGLLAVACGGGGGGGGTPSKKIKGTAAAGAPIIGTVTIKDSSIPPEMKTVPIEADGDYSVDVSDMTAPFAFRADGYVGGREYHLYSAATSGDVGGTINITPFTDLILANIANQLAENYFSGGDFSGLTPEQLNAAEAELQATLQPILTAVGLSNSLDLLRTSFNADHTDLDAVLDVIQVSMDQEAGVASLVNILNADNTVSIDLATGGVTGGFDATDGTAVAGGLTDLQAIAQGFETFSNLYRTSYPGPTNQTLLNLFKADGFLFDGMNFDAFLGMITNNPDLIGIQFTGVRIESLDDAAGTATVAFQTMQNGRTMRDAPHLFYMVREGNAWKMLGNQKIAYTFVEPTAYYYPTEPREETGLNFHIRDDGGYGIDYAVVTGPGLPEDGLLFVYDIAWDEFRLFDEDTQQLTDRDFYEMDDAQTAMVPEFGGVYTFALYEANGTIDQSDDELLATYTTSLWGRPFGPSEIGPSNFATASTTPTLANYTSGNITVNWTIPAGTYSDAVYINLQGQNGSVSAETSMLSPTDTSETLTFSQGAVDGIAPVQYKNMDLLVIDDLGRVFTTVLYHGSI